MGNNFKGKRLLSGEVRQDTTMSQEVKMIRVLPCKSST